jgi:hypothetical protein
VARAAAAYALGELGAQEETGPLLAMTEGSDVLAREAALVSLARLMAAKGDARSAAPSAMADAVLSSSREKATGRGAQLAKAGTFALVVLATKGAADPKRDVLPVPEEGLDAEKALEQLVTLETTEKDRADAFVAFRDVFRRSALGALQTSDDRARTVLDALGRGDGTFEPFVGPRESADTKAAREKGREMLVALEPSIVALARHPDVTLRVKAIYLLARSSSEATSEVVRILKEHPQWSMRTLAAGALGRLGKVGSAKEATQALSDAARTEPFALVREAALVALVDVDPEGARSLARDLSTKDAEPKVREVAARIAKTGR